MSTNEIQILMILAAGVVFAVLLRLGRRICARCGRKFTTILFWRQRALCISCQAEKGQVSFEAKLTAAIFLSIGGVCLFSVVREHVAGTGAAMLWTLGGIGIPFLLGILIQVVRHPETRRQWIGFGRMLLREPESRDFTAARRAAGAEGKVLHLDGATLWTDAADSVAVAIQRGMAIARREVHVMTGQPVKAPRPLRVICFSEESAFAEYSRTMSPDAGVFRGYYSGLIKRRVVLCSVLAELFPGSLAATLAHETAHHLLWRRGRKAPWLQEGLGSLVERASDSTVEPFARERLLRAASARGELFSARDLLSMRYAALHLMFRDALNTTEIGRAQVFYMQSADFLAFLRGRDEVAFRQFVEYRWFLAGRKRAFRDCFGMGPDTAMNQWLGRLRSLAIPPHAAPLPCVRERIDAEIVPVLLDSAAPLAQRLRAIRCMASAGYTWRSDLLAGLSKADADPLRAEAQRALENLAGEATQVDAAPA